jgi:hypothetical protein
VLSLLGRFRRYPAEPFDRNVRRLGRYNAMSFSLLWGLTGRSRRRRPEANRETVKRNIQDGAPDAALHELPVLHHFVLIYSRTFPGQGMITKLFCTIRMNFLPHKKCFRDHTASGHRTMRHGFPRNRRTG